jgi:hypothetical protein
MNEKIRELIKLVGTDVSGKWMNINNSQKLAELIVKEMLVTCKEHPAWTGRMIGEEIKQHFGVEE